LTKVITSSCRLNDSLPHLQPEPGAVAAIAGRAGEGRAEAAIASIAAAGDGGQIAGPGLVDRPLGGLRPLAETLILRMPAHGLEHAAVEDLRRLALAAHLVFLDDIEQPEDQRVADRLGRDRRTRWPGRGSARRKGPESAGAAPLHRPATASGQRRRAPPRKPAPCGAIARCWRGKSPDQVARREPGGGRGHRQACVKESRVGERGGTSRPGMWSCTDARETDVASIPEASAACAGGKGGAFAPLRMFAPASVLRPWR
jgi:hypothetical protein